MNELKLAVDEALESLDPMSVTVKLDESGFLHITVVAEQFHNMGIVQRIHNIIDLMEEKAEWVCERHLLLVKAFTNQELAELGLPNVH